MCLCRGVGVGGAQCKPRSDAADLGVRSGSILFASHPAILHTFTDNKMDVE